MQRMLNDSFAKLESGLDMKVDSIIKCIDEVAAAFDSLVTHQAEMETRISALDDDIAQLKGKLAVPALEKLNTSLAEKIADLEGH